MAATTARGRGRGNGRLQRNEQFFQQGSNAGGGANGAAAADAKVRRAFQRCAESGVLNLSEQNLTGDLPASVCGFQDNSWSENWWEQFPVTKIDVSHNQLNNIPPDIANLAECIAFVAVGNQLRDVPEELFVALPLKQLNLRQNQLERLPARESLARAETLVELVLGENQLRALPIEILNLVSLEVLDVSSNQLTELPDNSGGWRCTRLKRLDISKNRIRPSLPTGMRACSTLREFCASGNSLLEVNEIFCIGPAEHHGWCDSLTLLDLSSNKLGPRLQLGGLRAIDTLNLASNNVASLVLHGPLPCLSVAILDSNRISEFPRALLSTSAPKLSTLDFANNDLTSLPPELGLSQSLKRIALVGNPLRSVRPELLQGGAEALKKFLKTRIEGSACEEAVCAAEMAQNDLEVELRSAAASHELCLDDRGLTQLPALPDGLVKLKLPRNKLEADSLLHALNLGTDRLVTLEESPLRVLAVPRNVLYRGTCSHDLLPRLLLGLPGLEEVDLSFNLLPSVGNSWKQAWGLRGEPPGRQLKWLDLSGNALSSFPGALVAACPALCELRLRQNQLADMASVSILLPSGAAMLRTLDLEQNAITEVPAWLPSVFPRLQTLLLANNSIGPSLPPELGFWESLQAVSLIGNPLRNIRQAIITKGWPTVASCLRERLPTGAPSVAQFPCTDRIHDSNNSGVDAGGFVDSGGRVSTRAAGATCATDALEDNYRAGSSRGCSGYLAAGNSARAVPDNAVRSTNPTPRSAASNPVGGGTPCAGASEEHLQRIRREISALEEELAGPGLARTKQSALSHSLRMKRGELLRAEREQKRAASVAEAFVEGLPP